MISAHRHLQRCVELAAEHGFGRIEVANRSQIAHALLYFHHQREVFNEALQAAEAARRVGHHRAELNARTAALFGAWTLGALDHLRAQTEEIIGLVSRLGARRFLQSCFLYRGKAALVEGRRAEALELLEEGLAISRQTGIRFHGPNILGGLAEAAADPNQRRRALAEGEAIIAQGAVGHNHLRFYPQAIDVALDLEDWDEAERYAQALEAYTRPELLPWSDFFIARGRALAVIGRGRRDQTMRAELERQTNQADRLELLTALPAMEQALAGF
jgi:tetratricopeptide (TPR) repeat protein